MGSPVGLSTMDASPCTMTSCFQAHSGPGHPCRNAGQGRPEIGHGFSCISYVGSWRFPRAADARDRRFDSASTTDGLGRHALWDFT